ncbi:hypothetical protein GCM10025759_19340 [Lysobacter panacisoli]|uniref:Uncharacterized protein n=1 Tax=Lysobacter panacisoli TaxID=1255263 RepID=A0ABP9LGF4_9GAMM
MDAVGEDKADGVSVDCGWLLVDPNQWAVSAESQFAHDLVHDIGDVLRADVSIVCGIARRGGLWSERAKNWRRDRTGWRGGDDGLCRD